MSSNYLNIAPMGVREYGIVDYKKKRIQVYDLENDDLKEYTFEDEIPVGIYEGKLTLNFKEL
jgi:Uma2 family endonuclease